MREIIRFAWGISSLGDFVVAMSDKGIVALEFSLMHAAMEDTLRIRFPEAELERSQEELTDVMDIVADVIDDPTKGCDLPLDLRGTPYEVEVWRMLREIPVGQTTSYGGARVQARHARSAGRDRCDCEQSDRGDRAVPSRHQEGRVDFRLSVGCSPQARPSGA